MIINNMIIVVTSDTHGNVEFVNKLKNAYPMAVKYLHAGDSCVHEFQIDPFLTVKGNCDYYVRNNYRIIEINDLRIFLFHGERFPLDKTSGYLLASKAKEQGCNILIHGHTHRVKYEFVDGVHIICPGSLVLPRGGEKTFAIIEFTCFDDLKVEFIEYGN